MSLQYRWNKIFEWTYNKIPDSCQVYGCSRAGVWGNENRVYVGEDKYVIMCDYCHAENKL